jgi:glutaminase
VYASRNNHRNQSIARLLQSFGRIYKDPAEATDLYTRRCPLNVSARDLAVSGSPERAAPVVDVADSKQQAGRRVGER